MRKSLLFGIVCFRERFWECFSFCSLLESYRSAQHSDQLSIFVYDNTDLEDWFEEYPDFDGINIVYVRDSKNSGISKAYNTIANYALANNYPFVVFLDQDTSLPHDFYDQYKHASNSTRYKLKIPKVFSGDKLISPSIYKWYRSFPIKKIMSNVMQTKNRTAINSGLMCDLDFFFEIGGYNESLRLDFCDHDFLERAQKYASEFEIIPVEILQNFSSDVHTKNQAINRYLLFVDDLKSYYKNRNLFFVFFMVDAPHLLRLTVKYSSLSFAKIRFSKSFQR